MKRDLITLILILVCAVGAIAQAATVEPTQSAESDSNLKKLDAAIELFQKKEYSKAEKAFRALRSENLQKPSWGMVSNNLGITLQIEKKHKEAIEVFKSVLASGVNDRDPGGHLMETFRNYRHKAAIQIALCYEAKGNMKEAIEFIRLARTKYIFQADCGTCANDAESALKRHEARLLSKMK
jgi:tetratricopeptide (TPR) repeat protein